MHIKNHFHKIITILIVVIFLSILFSGCSNLNSVDTVEDNSNSGISNQIFSASSEGLTVENILPVILPESGTANRPIAVMVENSFAARPQSAVILRNASQSSLVAASSVGK